MSFITREEIDTSSVPFHRAVMRLFVVAFFMAFVGYMSLRSSYPGVIQDLFNTLGSVVLHFLAYSGLTVIYFWAFLRRHAKGHLWAAFFSISYGLALEVAQLWIPGRSFSLGDLAVNCLGVALAAMGIVGFKGLREVGK